MGAGRVLFAIAAGFLTALALMLVGFALYYILNALFWDKAVQAADFGYIVIDAVGYIVIAIAILDIAKHIVEEEVLAKHGAHRTGTSRRSLSKFISIISIAVYLEGLVLVFKVTQDDVKLLIYPVMLLLSGVAMTVGLALFQWLGADHSRERGPGSEPV
ncbi:MAG: GNAT family acetyltransferase [Hyphomicrobiales bacterium]